MIGGECAGAVAVAVDITESARAEEQMRSDLRAMSLMQDSVTPARVLATIATRVSQTLDAAVAITNTSRGLPAARPNDGIAAARRPCANSMRPRGAVRRPHRER